MCSSRNRSTYGITTSSFSPPTNEAIPLRLALLNPWLAPWIGYRTAVVSTVRIVLTENMDGSLSAESASIHLQEYQDSFDGMQLMNLEEAYCRMTEYIR